MGFALVPPTHPVLTGFMGVAGGQGALVVIGLNRVNGEECPLAAVNAAFDPDAVMTVFLEVNAINWDFQGIMTEPDNLPGLINWGRKCHRSWSYKPRSKLGQVPKKRLARS